MRSRHAVVDVGLLRKAVRAGTPGLVQRIVDKIPVERLAHVLSDLAPGELRVVFRHLLRGRRLGATLRALPDALLPDVVERLEDPLLARLLTVLDADDAARVARLLDPARRDAAFALLPDERAALLAELLAYDLHSAGGRMTPRFLAVDPQTTIGEAIRLIREAPPEIPVFYLYVVEPGERLVGVVSLSQLVKTPDDQPVGGIMVPEVVSVPPEADQEAVARLVAQRDILAVPVVREGRILGIITIDDVIDVLEQEATEDMYNMAGLSGGDRVFSSPWASLVKRIPWNTLNLGTALMAATVVSIFEGTIHKMVALAVFMPVVAGIGGSTGNQTLTVMIRGITLGELEFSSAWRALLKEVIVGLSIGLALGTAMALIAFFWKGNAVLGLVVFLAMVANLMLAAFVGTAIPLTLKRLGLDPALGGSILVTMFTDSLGFLCFLGLAALFMPYML